MADNLEDATQIAAAIAGAADFIVTGDKKGFANSPVTVVTPLELCEALEN